MSVDKKGCFIVFEGLDGSGTTTHSKLLAEYLEEKKYKVKITEEPTNNIIGGVIRGVLTKEWQIGQVGLQLLFAADRAHHLEREILPITRKKQAIISARYFFSSIAYGSLTLDTDWLYDINRNFPLPDLVFYLRVSPKECLERINKNRIDKELFEEEKKLEKVQREYDRMAKKFENFYIINGQRSITKVSRDVKKIVSEFLSS